MADGLLRLTLRKDEGARLGATFLIQPQPGGGGVVTLIALSKGKGGIIDKHNERDPSNALAAGDVVLEVNGEKEPMVVMDLMSRSGSLAMVVRRGSTEQDFVVDVACSGGGEDPAPRWAVVKRRQSCDGATVENSRSVCLMPVVCAGDAGVDHCAICMESVGPAESATLLACKHGFHQSCMARWILQARRRVCPLCVRDVC